MPTEHIVALLIQERDKLNRAIEALQGPVKRRGRPPKRFANVETSMNPKAEAASKTHKKVVWSAARKKAHIARMKAYWAKRKAKKS
jgi:hypothetical protein